jgi:hypothetical protein
MKLEEFIRLKQGGDTVMQYLNKFNHLSQYAIDQVDTDLKKKNCFMRGWTTSFNGKWQHAWTAPTVRLSVQNWQWKPKMRDLENQRGLQVKGQIKGLKRELGWWSDLLIKIVLRLAHLHIHSSSPSLFVPLLPPLVTISRVPLGIRFPALPSSSSGCFNCGKSIHSIKDCPYPKQNKSNFQQTTGNSNQGKGNTANTSTGKNFKKTGRVYYTQVATTPEGKPVMMGTFLVANHPTVILFDSGASHTFISKNFVEKYCILCTESREGFVIHSPGGWIFTKEVAFHISVTLVGQEFPTNMIVTKGQDIDVILGMNWLAQHKPIINTDLRTIKLSHGHEEIQLSIPVIIPTKASGRVYESIVQEIQDIPVVCEFLDVFTEDLSGLPPERDV